MSVRPKTASEAQAETFVGWDFGGCPMGIFSGDDRLGLFVNRRYLPWVLSGGMRGLFVLSHFVGQVTRKKLLLSRVSGLFGLGYLKPDIFQAY